MFSFRGFISFILLLVPSLLLAQSDLDRLPTDSLLSTGIQYVDADRYREAEQYLSEARERYNPEALTDTSSFFDLMMNYSYTLYQRAKFDEAISELDIFQPILEQRQDSLLLLRVENYRGLIYKKQHQFDQALTHYKNALSLATQIRDSVWIGILYDNMGGVSRTMGELKESVSYRQQALDILEKVGTDLDISITLNNLGLTFIQLSMADRAYPYLSKSLELAKGMDNTYRLSNAYSNMGLVHFEMGNYDLALIAYQKALAMARKIGNPIKVTRILNNLGILYSRLGDKQKALEYYHNSLQLALDSGIDDPGELSRKYKNIASRQLDLGEIEEASKNFYKALKLRKEVGDKHEITLSYLDMAQVERRKENYEKAFSYARRGKQLADSLDNRSLIIDAHQQMGFIHQRTKKYKEALSHFRIAYRHAEQLSSQYTLTPLSHLAYTFNYMDSDSALYYGQKLVETIESNRSKVGELSIHKSGFFEGYSNFYVDLAAWMMKYRGDEEKAFNLVEASKARALLEELTQASENLDEQLSDDVRLKKQQLMDQIEHYQGQMDTTQNPEQQKKLNSELRDAELEYAAFMNELRATNPNYKKLNYPSPITAEQAQQLVADDTAILEYAFGNNALLVFLVTNEKILMKRVNVTEGGGDSQQITSLVQQFRDKILAHAPSNQLKAQSDSLVRHLIDPFQKELSAYSNLIIIPDQALAYLPFEALSLNNRYLVEQFNVKYAPSFTTFSLLKKRDNQNPHQREMLAVAGSNFGGSSNTLNRGEAFAPLPATLAEVDSIATKFSDAEILKQGNYEEEFIKENLRKNFRFVHLATHGIIDEDHPNLSGLALSSPPEEASDKNDGLLRSSEIYQLSINSDMIVLSACNTGMGKMVKGEGILGLQRSFFYAGVPTVSVSLWSVYDRSTAYFMDQFYTFFLETSQEMDSPLALKSWLRWAGWDQSVPFGAAARAMRQAKLQMIDHPLYNHPIYWAPFIVVGR